MNEKYLTFKVDNKMYAFRLKCLREIVHQFVIEDLPRQPDFVSGLLNLRGEVIGVYDLNYIIKKKRTSPKKRS